MSYEFDWIGFVKSKVDSDKCQIKIFTNLGLTIFEHQTHAVKINRY